MSRLNPAKLNIRWRPGVTTQGPVSPRRYTLTHSDATGDLFLTIGADYDRGQVGGLYTRLMRDEVLAEWVDTAGGFGLDVHCHVSGGVVFGSAAWRESILRMHMPMVIQAFRQGDAALFAGQPELDRSPVSVHFHSHRPTYDRVEPLGMLGDYVIHPAGTDVAGPAG